MGGGAGPQDRGQRERGRSDSVSRASARGNKSAVSNYQQVQIAFCNIVLISLDHICLEPYHFGLYFVPPIFVFLRFEMH